jgi:hypothetical protein
MLQAQVQFMTSGSWDQAWVLLHKIEYKKLEM